MPIVFDMNLRIFKENGKELTSKDLTHVKDSKFVLINEPLMSNNGIYNKVANEFINQTAKRVSSHSNVC